MRKRIFYAMRKLGTENPQKLRIRSGCPTTSERASSTAKIIAVNCLCSGNYLRSSPLVSFTFKQALPSLPAAEAKDHLLCLTKTFNSQIPRRNPIQKSRRQAGCAVNVLRHLRFASSTFCVIYVLRHLRLLDGIWYCANKRAY